MRKYVWIIRLVFLAALALLLVGAVQLRREHEQGTDLRPVYGSTSQGEKIEFALDGEGRPRKLDVLLGTRCSDGERFAVHWFAHEDRARFQWAGERLRVRQSGRRPYPDQRDARFDLTLRARISPDDALEGYATGTWRWLHPRWGTTTCRSRAVEFASADHGRPLAGGKP